MRGGVNSILPPGTAGAAPHGSPVAPAEREIDRMHVVHVIPALRQGGAERLLADLVRRSPSGLRHTVVTLLDEEPFYEIGCPVVPIGFAKGPADLLALRRLSRILRTLRGDVVHAWMYHANLLTALAAPRRVPLLWSIHNTDLPLGEARSTTIAANYLAAALSRIVPAAVVYCSESAARFHRRCGYAARRSIVVANGVDLDRFRPDPEARAKLRDRLGIGPRQPVVGLVGRFAPQKDFATGLAALARLAGGRNQLTVLVAGRGCGPDNAALTEMIARERLDGRVRLLGGCDEVPALLNSLDCLLISSSHGEAMPVVALEAMACGVPVVATAVGDLPELVGRADRIVPPRRPELLAQAVERVLARDVDDSAAGADRERMARSFSLDRMVADYADLYAQIARS